MKTKRDELLNILCLEDSPKDAEIMSELLIGAGYKLNVDCTDKEKEYVSFLRNKKYDLILSDFKLPGFDGFKALKWAVELCPEIPFICISGTIGEETAVELLKMGAVDYVMKDNLKRLPAVIKRALDEAKEKEARKLAEKELQASELRLRRFYESGMVGVIYWNMQGQITDCNDKFLEMVGYTRNDLKKGQINWGNMTPDEFKNRDEASIIELKTTGVNKMPFEKEYFHKDGSRIPIIIAGAMLDENNSEGVAFVLDITERKKVEMELKKKSDTLEDMNSHFVGRELKMVELKKEINELLKRLNEPEKYRIVG